MTGNPVLAALRDDRVQVGLWQNLPGSAAAEIAASSGVDWVLFDQEHAPRSHEALIASINAAERRGAHVVVRVSGHDREEIGRMLDLGVRSILVPTVESAAQARALAAACDFAPNGTRGVSAQTRAGAWGTDPGFLRSARQDICLMLQIESVAGAENVDEIASTPGVDVVFVGAADLAASMGHLGDPSHPEVTAVVSRIIASAHRAGRPVGVLVKNTEAARAAIAEGCRFIGIGTDSAVLARGLQAMSAPFTTDRKADHG